MPESGLRHNADILTLGLGTTVAIWLLAYLTLTNPTFILAEGVFVLMLLALVAGGYAAGRFAGRSWKGGAAVGLVSAVINLLMFGSAVAGLPPQTAALWTLSLVGGSMLLGAGGAVLGRMAAGPYQPADPPAHQRAAIWLARFTIVAAAAVFLLIVTGGFVTSLKAGLAVPDWPGSFGHNMVLYPLVEMLKPENRETGVHFEHAHRLYGVLVGLTSILLMALTFAVDRRAGVRALAVAVFLAVCLQGLAGGLRVTEDNLTLAILHGVFGQCILAAVVMIAVFVSPTWTSGAPALATRSASTDRTMSVVLLVALIVQLALGAAFRHLSKWPGATPGSLLAVLHSHVAFAVVVTLLAGFCGSRAWGLHAAVPVLRRTGLAMLTLLTLQITLGVIAFFLVPKSPRAVDSIPPLAEAIVTALHQATGALLLASAAALAPWNRRLLRPTGKIETGKQNAEREVTTRIHV